MERSDNIGLTFRMASDSSVKRAPTMLTMCSLSCHDNNNIKEVLISTEAVIFFTKPYQVVWLWNYNGSIIINMFL